MAKFRLNRRALLRGAGGIAIALPWLECMGENRAWAAGSPALRFVTVFQPGGTVRAGYTPTGTETAPVLSPILMPFQPVLSKILIIDGLDMKSAVGEQHQAGIIALLTGTTQNNPPPNGGLPGMNSYALGPSIDQVVASRISTGIKARSSIQMAVRWATGKSHGLLSPINSMNFEDNTMFSPIPPRLDPQQIFSDLFSTLTPGANNAAIIQRKKSILDFIDQRYSSLSPKLGVADRMKIDQHLTKIRELEMGISVMPPPSNVACKQPPLVDTSDYNPRTGLMSADDGSIKDVATDAAIPKVGKFLMDMLVMSLACDMTAVATLQWTDTEAKHTFPWLNLPNHHHFYQHDGGFQAPQCQQIATWYSQQHTYLVQQMAAVDMGGHTLLDESVVFFGSELQEPPTHIKTNMPFILAGNGGGLRTGRWVKYASLPHNNLLVSILNLFGDTRTTFGDPKYCTGPLANII